MSTKLKARLAGAEGQLGRLRAWLGPMAWGTAVVFVIQRGTDVANLVCKLFLGRVLPPLDFGAVEPIGATVAVLAMPAGIIYGTAVKSISRLNSQGRHAQCRALVADLQKVALAGSIVSFVVVFALRNFILTRLHLESTAFVWMIALMFVARWWAPLITAIVRAEHRYKLLLLSNTAGPVLLVVLTLVLAGFLGLGLKGAIAARVIVGLSVIALLMTLIRGSHRGTREPYPEERAVMVRMLLPMTVIAVTGSLAVNFDRLFVRNFLVDDSAGLSAIFMLGQLPRLTIAPLSFVLFPIAAAQHASGRELGRLLAKAAGVAALVTLGFCMVFAVAATPLLRIWRPEFAPYGRYVWVYALMVGLQALVSVMAQVEMARHEYRFLWFQAPPIALACAGLYVARDIAHVPVTLGTVIWTLTAAQAVTCVLVGSFIRLRRK